MRNRGRKLVRASGWRRRLEERSGARWRGRKLIKGLKLQGGGLEDEIGWPQVSEMNAALQIPSFKKVDPLVSHGGSAFHEERLGRELVRGGRILPNMWGNPAGWTSRWKKQHVCLKMC